MAAAEPGEDRRQPGHDEVLRQPQPQPAAHLHAAEVGQRAVAGVEDRRGELDHGLAVGGQRDGVGVAGEQRPVDSLLQLADVLAHRALPHAEAFGGAGETQGVRHGGEGAQQHWVQHGGHRSLQ